MESKWDGRKKATSLTPNSVEVALPNPKATKLLQRAPRIPDDVRADLKDWKGKSWGYFRQKVYKRWHESLKNIPQSERHPLFTDQNMERMRNGLAPKAPDGENAGLATSMELDHVSERQDDEKKSRVCDINNLQPRSPLSHDLKITRKFSLETGAVKPKSDEEIRRANEKQEDYAAQKKEGVQGPWHKLNERPSPPNRAKSR